MPTVAPAATRLLTRREAAAVLALSLRTFERHIQPHLKLVRVGSSVRIPEAEVTRWVKQRAAKAS